MGSLEAARRSFAEELRSVVNVTHQPVIDAFARVPRERFVGPGPWQIRGSDLKKSMTPDDDPRHLYHNVLAYTRTAPVPNRHGGRHVCCRLGSPR